MVACYFGCKNDSKIQKTSDSEKVRTEIISSDTLKTNEVSKLNNNSENCYDYLTELIRSSNFPFENIKKEKINTLIDEDNGEMIRVKLFYDTDGIGTIGWVEYHLKDRKLFNSSANLEEPELLKFNIDYAKKFENCKGVSGIKKSDNLNVKSIESLYNIAKLVKLPNKYNYDFIV